MHEPPTKACGKRAGLCVIEVCSSLFIFITVDRSKVFSCPPATSQTLCVMPLDTLTRLPLLADGLKPNAPRGKPTRKGEVAYCLAARATARPKQGNKPRVTTN